MASGTVALLMWRGFSLLTSGVKMFIPLEVIKAFRQASILPTSQPVSPPHVDKVQKEACPLGCDPDRTEILISKIHRRTRGRFVTAYYRKTSPEFQAEQKQEKFKIFNNPSLWS
jgi:hypothetical protein